MAAQSSPSDEPPKDAPPLETPAPEAESDSGGPCSRSAAASRQATGETAPTPQGQLLIDATVAPADIRYPTDLDLLHQCREISEALIDTMWEPGEGRVNPRTDRQVARRDYLAVAKQRKKQGKQVRKSADSLLPLIMNVIWILIGGIWIALTHLIFGIICAITIIGIPFAKQHLKLARFAFTPFGVEFN